MNNPMIMSADIFSLVTCALQAETRQSGMGRVSEVDRIVQQSKAAS
jgi:hypothetical protein